MPAFPPALGFFGRHPLLRRLLSRVIAVHARA